MTLRINTPDLDVDELMKEVRSRIAARKADGKYEQYDLSAAAALEMDNIKIDQDHLSQYLPNLWRASNIDLGDFPISAKVPVLGKGIVILKKLIWKLLKFYTWRLFSQQKEFNARAAVLIQALILRYEQKIIALEERIAALEEEGRS